MRIATWNVNSVGARLPRLLDWLQTREPDVVALQETKTNDAGFPTAEVEALGYEVLHVGDGRWNGVAILSRVGLEPVSRQLPGMTEPRYAVADCGGLRTVSVYVPNGRSVDDPHYAYKLDWFAALAAHARRPRPGAAAGDHGRLQRRAHRRRRLGHPLVRGQHPRDPAGTGRARVARSTGA